MTHTHSFLNIIPGDYPQPAIALLGGGGKTSLMFQVGKEFANQNKKVLLTSITKAGPTKNLSMTLIAENGTIPLSQLFKSQNPLYLLKDQIRKNKYNGISVTQLASFLPKADVTLFECDGSRNLPLKAHSDWDPVVPGFATHVIIVVGADVINTKLSDGKVHRPGLFKSIWGVQDDRIIDIPFITKIVTDQRGYISKIPPGLKKIYYINKADNFPKEANTLALSLATKSPDPVFWGSTQEKWIEKIV